MTFLAFSAGLKHTVKPWFSSISDEDWTLLNERRRRFQFLASARWPLKWIVYARRHKRAADVIYESAYAAYERDMTKFVNDTNPTGEPSAQMCEEEYLAEMTEMDLISDYYLLIGYTLECLLKGYLLAMSPELIRDGAKLDKTVATHDLSKLCQDAKIALPEDDHHLLNFFTRCIIWSSKYPIPLHLKAHPSPLETDPHEPSMTRSPYTGKVKDSADRLVSLFTEMLKKEDMRIHLSPDDANRRVNEQ